MYTLYSTYPVEERWILIFHHSQSGLEFVLFEESCNLAVPLLLTVTTTVPSTAAPHTNASPPTVAAIGRHKWKFRAALAPKGRSIGKDRVGRPGRGHMRRTARCMRNECGPHENHFRTCIEGVGKTDSCAQQPQQEAFATPHTGQSKSIFCEP
jgi:hypothetical protein